MRKIITAIIAIIILLTATTNVFANNSDVARRRKIADVTASKFKSITPEVLSVVKNWAENNGTPYGKFWRADDLGVATCDGGDCTIAAWDGSILTRINGWSTNIKNVGSWKNFR